MRKVPRRRRRALCRHSWSFSPSACCRPTPRARHSPDGQDGQVFVGNGDGEDWYLFDFFSLAEHFVNTVHIGIYIYVTMFTMSSVLTTWWQNQLIRLTNQREGTLTAWWNVWMSPIFTFSAATLAAKATRTRASISTSETEYFQRTGGYWAIEHLE